MTSFMAILYVLCSTSPSQLMIIGDCGYIEVNSTTITCHSHNLYGYINIRGTPFSFLSINMYMCIFRLSILTATGSYSKILN